MPDTFRFKQEPEWSLDSTSVTLCREDFESLLKFAEKWLNYAPGMIKEEYSVDQTKPMTLGQRLQSQKEDVDFWSVLEQGYCQQVEQENFQIKLEETPDHPPSVMCRVGSLSKLLNSAEGQKLGKSPLDFLSKELSKFKSAKEIFSTRYFLPETAVAMQFHKACDNVPNVLVIIKSGQYIAGGYTEVPFESKGSAHGHHPQWKPDPKRTTFLFSVNKQKVYPLKDKQRSLNCMRSRGPKFGRNGLSIADNYAGEGKCADLIHLTDSSFYRPTNTAGELFGKLYFAVDEYEVYKLE